MLSCSHFLYIFMADKHCNSDVRLKIGSQNNAWHIPWRHSFHVHWSHQKLSYCTVKGLISREITKEIFKEEPNT